MLSLWAYSLPLSWRFSRASFCSILKVNEFTLAGAVLADSLDRGAGKKETAGSQLTPRLKARHFQKNTIHPQKPERIQYAQGTLRPCNPRAMASHCLILVFVKVSSFQMKNKSDTQRAFTLVLADIPKLFLDTKKAWS